MNKLERLLTRALQERESGKAEKSLATLQSAFFLASQQKNHERVVQCFVDRAIVFRHLYEERADVLFAILARKDAEAILEMVKMWGVSERLHTAYYLLGQAALLFQEYGEAEKWFFKALRYYKGDPTEKGSWRYHWAKSLYLSGEKKRGLLAFSHALTEIKNNVGKANPFLVHVYLSGAYASFAQVLAKDNSQDAKKYYELSKEIISSDARLVVRKKQLRELEKFLKKCGTL